VEGGYLVKKQNFTVLIEKEKRKAVFAGKYRKEEG